MKLMQDEHGIISGADSGAVQITGGTPGTIRGPTEAEVKAEVRKADREWLKNLIRVLNEEPDLARELRMALARGDH